MYAFILLQFGGFWETVFCFLGLGYFVIVLDFELFLFLALIQYIPKAASSPSLSPN